MLCVVSSAGGHLTEALDALSKTHVPMYFVTYDEPHVHQRLADKEAYFVKDPHTSFVGYIINTIQSIKILWKKKPKVIFTTGAGIALATCVFGKIMGAKIIFLESGARITTASKTGKLMYFFSDTYFVQWKPLLELFPKAVYVGPLL
jgi:UDP-N-acetylglucosamine:LPS N-acetylglucosamine transferase